jgi:hypothetical protein
MTRADYLSGTDREAEGRVPGERAGHRKSRATIPFDPGAIDAATFALVGDPDLSIVTLMERSKIRAKSTARMW